MSGPACPGQLMLPSGAGLLTCGRASKTSQPFMYMTGASAAAEACAEDV